MSTSARLVLLAFALSAPLSQAANTKSNTKVNPIEKVIEMLSELQQKIIKEGEAASKTYDEFAEWCEEESKNLGFSIKTAKAEAEDLMAVIEEAEANIKDFDVKIAALSASIAADEADVKASTAIREKEFADFDAEEKDLMETIDTLERAKGIIEREMQGGASLVQLQKAGHLVDMLKMLVDAHTINTRDGAKLTALIQSQSKDQ